MDPVKILQNLKPQFIKAGKLACQMQGTIKPQYKSNTGNPFVDIVTKADFKVQEFLLQAIAETELINCKLFAEENTPTVTKFKGSNKFYLMIDPINGTSLYANKSKHFDMVISLHDGKNLLYTLKHYPALNWTHEIVGNNYFVTGQTPKFNLPAVAKQSIVYYEGNPKQFSPDVYARLEAKGIVFRKKPDISSDYGATTMYLANQVAGYYDENANVYDGLVSMHFAIAKGYKIYSGDSLGREFSLFGIKKRTSGFYYPGYYLALSELAN